MATLATDMLNPALEALLPVLLMAQEPLHFRSLSRTSGLPLSSLRSELARLHSSGVVDRSCSKNRVLYTLNRNASLTLSLRQLLALQQLKDARWESFPTTREYEEKLVKLCAHVGPAPAVWRKLGNADFMAGLAVWLSGHTGFDRGLYLQLAEALKPGASDFDTFRAWHEQYRPPPSRFFAALDREMHKHARTTN